MDKKTLMRLAMALRDAKPTPPPEGATDLARLFNERALSGWRDAVLAVVKVLQRDQAFNCVDAQDFIDACDDSTTI